MAIQATNYDKDKEYLIAEIKDVPRQNLLINGDFKIWQRGTTFSDIANQYTADMWRIENAAASVTLVERSTDVPSNADCNYSIHLKDTQSNPNFYLIQKGMNFKGSFVLSFWYKSNTNLPTYYVDGSGTHLLGVNKPSPEWKYVSYKFSSNNLSTLNIIQGASNGDFYIASVRLYRGEIDYPHVEEDYAIALMRCRSKLIYYPEDVIMAAVSAWSNAGIMLTLPCELDSTPTISGSVTIQRESVQIQSSSLTLQTNFGGNTITIYIAVSGLTIGTMYQIISNGLSISCEPL